MPSPFPTKAVYVKRTGGAAPAGWTIAPYHTYPGLERLYYWHLDYEGEMPPYASQDGKPEWDAWEGDTRPGAV